LSVAKTQWISLCLRDNKLKVSKNPYNIYTLENFKNNLIYSIIFKNLYQIYIYTMDDDDSQVTNGGKKKSNGHKANCKCPICKNMKMKKGGSMQELRPANFLGGKKANGHKATCKCPICVNMKHQKASKKNRRVTRSKLTRRGGADDDSDSDSDSSSSSSSSSDSDSDTTMGGGKKKRKGNGHKAACKCPICKNMKKGGVKSPYAKEDPDNTTKPTWMTDRELEAAEKGETGLGKDNIQPQQTTTTTTSKIDVGGSRRRRKSRKTRKIRKRR
jgi:hypothetical protein